MNKRASFLCVWDCNRYAYAIEQESPLLLVGFCEPRFFKIRKIMHVFSQDSRPTPFTGCSLQALNNDEPVGWRIFYLADF